MLNLTIGQMQKMTGISASAIRYYREEGIIKPQQMKNGYYSYSYKDVLNTLFIKELRSREFPVDAIKKLWGGCTIEDYLCQFEDQSELITENINFLKLALERNEENRSYVEKSIQLLNESNIDIYEGKNTWTIGLMNREKILDTSVSTWANYFPFTYVNVRIPREEIESNDGMAPYKISLCYGALAKYVDEFHLPISEYASFHSAGRYIRTCIKTDDPFMISKADIETILNYFHAHGKAVSQDIIGRLIFIDTSSEKTIYYFRLWTKWN